MKRAFGAIGFLALLSISAPGQAPAPPTFVAADVHASPATANPFFDRGFLPGGRYQLRNATLVNLIAEAWEMDVESVVGGPAWLDTDRFDVVAKAPPKSTGPERELMLRALLAERFKLVVHNDQKELQVYAMAVGKRGSQLQESGGPSSADCKPGDFQEGPPPMITVACPSMTMTQFAKQLHQMAGGYIHNQVVDFTGLKGAYAITVKWSPAGAPKTNDAGEPTGKVTIFDAVDKQLGLNLELTKRAVPVIAVDSVERTPTPNDPDVLKNLPSAPTEFEAATLKLNKSGKEDARLQPKPGGRIEGENIPLKLLISFAWNFDFNSDDRIVGLPKWGNSDRYDFIAKATVLPGEQPPPIDDLRVMIRALLVERFKMTVHTENQPVKVWTLTVSKRGSKLKQADPSTRSNCTPGNGQAGSGASALPFVSLTCQNTTMERLAEAMHLYAGGYVDHSAVDMTDLKGGYDFTITWTPRGALSSSGRSGQPGPSETVSDPSGGTTFFDAVEKQLGLHLEGGQKHPLPVLVIDHIEPLGVDN